MLCGLILHQMKINRLKIVLAEKSKASKCLAIQLGKSENTVSRWWINETQPSMNTFVEFAKPLNIKESINSAKI